MISKNKFWIKSLLKFDPYNSDIKLSKGIDSPEFYDISKFDSSVYSVDSISLLSCSSSEIEFSDITGLLISEKST